jgi:hypothetical protein
MRVRVTWPDGTKTEEFMHQKYRQSGEMEQREDYYIIKEFRGAIAEICVDRCCLKIEHI